MLELVHRSLPSCVATLQVLQSALLHLIQIVRLVRRVRALLLLLDHKFRRYVQVKLTRAQVRGGLRVNQDFQNVIFQVPRSLREI